MATTASNNWNRAKRTYFTARAMARQTKKYAAITGGYLTAPASVHLAKAGPSTYIKHVGAATIGRHGVFKSKLSFGAVGGLGLLFGDTLSHAFAYEMLGFPAARIGARAGAAVGGSIGRGVTGYAGRKVAKAVGYKKMAARGASRAMAGARIGSLILPGVGTAVGTVVGFVAGSIAFDVMYDAAVSAPKKIAEYGKRVKGLETGQGFDDNYGIGATLRSRSLREIQRSHINARNALGMESLYIHVR